MSQGNIVLHNPDYPKEPRNRILMTLRRNHSIVMICLFSNFIYHLEKGVLRLTLASGMDPSHWLNIQKQRQQLMKQIWVK